MAKEKVLHELIFKNDPEGLKEAVQDKTLINSFFRGQTPLTLAISLGHFECVQVLLENGCSSILRNEFGYTPFQEATSFGNRQMIKLVHQYKRKELARWVDEKGKSLVREISMDLQDVEFEMNWSFQSIIPFLSLLCPSDTYKIYKKGMNVRIDTTLVGFENLNWKRGNISFIFNTIDEPRLVICDHDNKIVQQLWPRDFGISDEQVEEDVSVALNTPIHASPDFDFKKLSITRAKNGVFLKYDRNELVEGFPTKVWNVDAFELQIHVRTEHLECHPLPEYKLQELREKERQAAAKVVKEQRPARKFVIANPDPDMVDEEEEKYKNYTPGLRNIVDYNVDMESWRATRDGFDIFQAHRDSLVPPPKPTMTLEEYLNGDTPVHLGRPMVIEENTRSISAKLWMYEPSGDPNVDMDVVPFRPDSIYPLLSLIGMGNEHFRALNDFLETTLPPGYPVQMEIPIGGLPLSAVIKTRNIIRRCDMDLEWFNIPSIEDGYILGEVIKDDDYE